MPDLTSSDHALFQKQKKHLPETIFSPNNDEI